MKNEKISKFLTLIKKFLKIVKNNPIKSILIVLLVSFCFYIINLRIGNKRLENDKIQLNDTIINKKIKIDSLNYQLDSIQMEYDSLDNEYKRKKEFYDFLKAVALRESSGNQWSINKYGMLGLYQFSPKTLHFLGIKEKRYDYLNCVETQNNAMLSYLRFNKNVLNDYIRRYDGKYFKGIHITASGILAGAHLTGAGGVIEFFEDNGKYNQVDGNNVHVKEYIEEFAGYNILASI